MSGAREQRTTFDQRGEARQVALRLEGDRLEATIDEGEPRKLEASSPSPGEVVLRDEKGRVVRALVARGADGEIWVSIGGRVARLSRRDERRARSHASHDTALEVPMPGTCRDVLVRAGDRVEKGALLVIVEAMKMEHEVRSPRAGVVKAVHAKKGEAVSPGTPLVEIEPFDAPA